VGSIIRQKQVIFLFFYIVACILVKTANADELKLAVASNFLSPIKNLASIYEKETGNKVLISSGSTGKLYAQIIHGAPYDLFFAANVEEPKRLEKSGHALSNSRLTYAIGKIIIWSKKHNISNQTELSDLLNNKIIKTLAVANPKTAPYGAAAMEIIHKLDISLHGIRVVKGENINQTWQFTQSGSVDVGFIAASQLNAGIINQGYHLNVPVNLYQAIEQQVVLLTSSKNPELGKSFLSFIRRADIKQRIEKFGYGSLGTTDVVALR